MNISKYNKSIIAQCILKGKNYYLRSMFDETVVLDYDKFKSTVSEGDILFINYNIIEGGSSETVYKKDSIINRYFIEFEKLKLKPFFSDEIMKEVEAIISNPGIDDPLLTDFTSFPFVTIDNDGSRDLDQAFYIEKKDSDYIIYYAITDASYYVKQSSSLFKESIRRGASYYLPGFSIPMLPRELSEGIISLNEGVARRSLVFIIHINSSGDIISEKVTRCKILSRAKLTYSGVQNFYDCTENSRLPGKEYTASIMCLQDAGKILAQNGDKRGVVNFQRIENTISIDKEGNNFQFKETGRDDVGRWNEQISLVCNMAGAGMLAPEGNGNDLHIHPVFRVHEAPEDSSLHKLEKVINSLVQIHSLNQCWIWRRGEETPGEYLSRLPKTGEESRITETIERQILITNQKSFFSDHPGQHFALKVNLYGRFSSPMREIVGIYSHNELMEKIGLETPDPDADDLLIREQVINSANRAKETQKTIDRFVNGLLLESVFIRELDIPISERPVHPGTILGMKDTRMYVLLDSPRLEIKVYNEDVESIPGANIKHYENVMELYGDFLTPREYKAGGVIALRLLSFDEQGKWHFIPADI